MYICRCVYREREKEMEKDRCMCMKTHRCLISMSDSFVTSWTTAGLKPVRLVYPWNSPGNNIVLNHSGVSNSLRPHGL